MRPGIPSDQELVVNIISKSFDENPSVNWVIKNDLKREQRIRHLAKYSFKTALRRNGVFISSGGKGVALCYEADYKKESILDYWDQLILVFKAIGILKIPSVLKRESYTKSIRPSSGRYLYFWYYGVEPGFNGNGDARELKQGIFQLADRKQLPIYLETSIDKNRIVYKRYGFELYHTWNVKEQNINLYFMRRFPLKTGSENK